MGAGAARESSRPPLRRTRAARRRAKRRTNVEKRRERSKRLRPSGRVLIALQANPSNFEGRMPIRAILFDKDGTLVDIQATLGPATCDVLHRLSDGKPELFGRLADLTRV